MNIKELLQSLPTINKKRKYWLVRTSAGAHFDGFMAGNFIAIGYNQITFEDIKAGNLKDEAIGVGILTEKIKKIYKEEKRPKHTARQLLKFTYKIKKGDIVLIPSKNSDFISFGEIKETPAFNEFDNKFDCGYIKRKKVRWLHTITRNQLDPNLYKLMYSHHTISKANQYDIYIDKILNSFFIKEDKAHLILNVKTTEEIKARSLFALGDLALDLFDEFCKEEELELNSDNFEVKLAMQSPGFIELAGTDISGIIILGIIIVAVAGGGFKLKVGDKVKVSLKSDGIIEKIRKFLNTKNNIKTKKELLEEHIKNLQIEDPQELIDILKKLDK